MPVKVIPFTNRFWPSEKSDLIALRMFEGEPTITMSLPFHEDTPNFTLTFSEAMDLKNAINQLLDTKLLEKPKENDLHD